ncbi:AEC family transporter [Vaginella massiliensis]|uniref:AEC family transporter n=1 Tax=Vaginella massiliensis TaxID=1816680 RepID=UPI0008391A0B|nr:AEC family transporter [Vaginella massiliensis]
MSSIILLFLCLLIGVLIKKIPQFPYNTHIVLNQFILFISLPAMALYYLPEVKLGWDLLFPAGVAWIAFGLAFVIFYGLGKAFGWSKSLIGCMILTAGLGNTSFVGIPVIEAMYGAEGIKTLIIVDLPGTFVVLSTLGIITAAAFSRHSSNLKSILLQVFRFPAFLAFLVGISMAAFNLHFSDSLQDVFGKLAATVSPIALVSVGFQLNINKRSKHWGFLTLGLLYQLVLLPIVIFVLYVLIFKQSGLPIKVSIVEAAMAPMITAAIVAGQYGLKPKLANMMIGIGIPISFVTLTIWYFFLEWFFA